MDEQNKLEMIYFIRRIWLKN